MFIRLEKGDLNGNMDEIDELFLEKARIIKE